MDLKLFACENNRTPEAQGIKVKHMGLIDASAMKILDVLFELHTLPTLSLDDVCRLVGRSHAQVRRQIRALTGLSFRACLLRCRLQEAHKILHAESCAISEVATRCGFRYLSHFSQAFKREYGVTPLQLQQLIGKRPGAL